ADQFHCFSIIHAILHLPLVFLPFPSHEAKSLRYKVWVAWFCLDEQKVRADLIRLPQIQEWFVPRLYWFRTRLFCPWHKLPASRVRESAFPLPGKESSRLVLPQ